MMVFIFATIVGLLLGVLGGLIPGLHSNTIAAVVISAQAFFISFLGSEGLSVALFAMLITHGFISLIPSTFLGVPDSGSALSVLPAHSLCLKGDGEEAIRLAALGSVYGLCLSVPVAYIIMALLPDFQQYIDWGTGIFIVGVMGYLIISSETPLIALIIFLTTGILGVFSISYSFLCSHAFGADTILMPLLTGLFGISVLVNAGEGNIPDQNFKGLGIKQKIIHRSAFFGTFAGTLVGWLPGLSNATANAVISAKFGYNIDKREFLISTGASNSANAVIGLAAFSALARTRNGVMAAIGNLNPPSFIIMLATGVITAAVVYPVTVTLSSEAVHLGNLNIKLINRLVIVFLTFLTFALTGVFGMMILALSVALGLIPSLLEVPRLYCMGAVMIPVILFSFGLL